MRNRYLLVSLILLGVVATSLTIRVSADAPVSASRESLSNEQKLAALEFAKVNHPQLATLIRKLEKRDAVEYQKALIDLSRTSEKLERVKSRDAERYEVELNLWKLDSRIRLLAARMASDERSSLEKELRTLLEQRTDLRLEQLQMDRERLAGRIDRIDGQIDQLSTERGALVDKEVDRLRKSVRTRTSTVIKKSSAKRETKPAKDKQKATATESTSTPANQAPPPSAS